MGIENALRYAVKHANPESLTKLARYLPATFIECALGATGTASVRRRKLPASYVVWLVVGMGLFRDRSIREVVEALDLVLPGNEATAKVAASSITEARARLGSEPIRWLFSAVGKAWSEQSASAHRWRELALFGIDGTTLRVADSAENREHFGGSKGRRGPSGYPMVRMTVLMALRSHVLQAAAFGPYRISEQAYAAQLVPQIPARSLTIVDRAYLSAAFLHGLGRNGGNRHWLTRTKSTTQVSVVKRLGKNDDVVTMKVSAAARNKDPSLPDTLQVRRIGYQVKGYRPQALLTSLMDPLRYPAHELVGLYHERWELELAYDELKTEMLDREECLRSRTPALVTQELWGVLLAFNLVRRQMEHVADELGTEPTRISFVGALHLIRDEFIWLAAMPPFWRNTPLTAPRSATRQPSGRLVIRA